MPCSVCFNSKTSKLDGDLSTLADKLLLFYFILFYFILLENTDNCSGAKKSAHFRGCINYAIFCKLN